MMREPPNMALSLKDRIYAYFRNNPNKWIPGAQIERLVQTHTKYVASNASRTCRLLAAEKKLQREERPWKNKTLAWYRYVPEESPEILSRRSVEWFDSLPDKPKEDASQTPA